MRARLLDREQLDVERQRRVAGDAAVTSERWRTDDDALGAGLAVRERGRDGELALATDLHARDTLVPALDDLALTEAEGERRALGAAASEQAKYERAHLESNTLPFCSLPM